MITRRHSAPVCAYVLAGLFCLSACDRPATPNSDQSDLAPSGERGVSKDETGLPPPQDGYARLSRPDAWFEGLPAELAPTEDGWHPFDIGKVEQWLNSRWKGKAVEIELLVHECVPFNDQNVVARSGGAAFGVHTTFRTPLGAVRTKSGGSLTFAAPPLTTVSTLLMTNLPAAQWAEPLVSLLPASRSYANLPEAAEFFSADAEDLARRASGAAPGQRVIMSMVVQGIALRPQGPSPSGGSIPWIAVLGAEDAVVTRDTAEVKARLDRQASIQARADEARRQKEEQARLAAARARRLAETSEIQGAWIVTDTTEIRRAALNGIQPRTPDQHDNPLSISELKEDTPETRRRWADQVAASYKRTRMVIEEDQVTINHLGRFYRGFFQWSSEVDIPEGRGSAFTVTLEPTTGNAAGPVADGSPESRVAIRGELARRESVYRIFLRVDGRTEAELVFERDTRSTEQGVITPSPKRLTTQDPDGLLEVGWPAPTLALRKPDGTSAFFLPERHGRVAVLSFWATWTMNADVPYGLASLADRFDSQAVTPMLISTREPGTNAAQWVKARSIPVALFIDGGQAAEDYLCSVLPTTYVIDRNGRVLWSGKGSWKAIGAEVEHAVARALDKK